MVRRFWSRTWTEDPFESQNRRVWEETVRFTGTKLEGMFLVELEPKDDERGFFARVFCQNEFTAMGLMGHFAQCNLSMNYARGTLRGMHYQVAPATEAKLIRCIRGAIYDAVVDMRPESPSYGSHIGVELTAENRRALYVPEMCAVGYQTLTDGAEVLYQLSGFYAPECERGVRYDDPAFGISWPLPVTVLSQKDASWSLGSAARGGRS